LEALIKQFKINKVKKVVPGGETGQESIFNGLIAIEEYFPKESIVLIHDAVRPILTEQLISHNISTVKTFGNAITSALPTETPLTIDKNNNIDTVYKRDIFRVAKAPQSFKLINILSVHRQAIKDQYNESIDSSSLMLKYGTSIRLIEGSSSNIKITTPTDYFIFKALVDAHYENQLSDNQEEFVIKY
jgi:2-C-methyl-D-erythritol 4-phosphate cytidylyltransferase